MKIWNKIKKSKYLNKSLIYSVIFRADTKLGKNFDIYLLIAILFNALLIILNSIPKIGNMFPILFMVLETFLTFLFTIEYILRIYCLRKPWRYIFSFYGIIDFISIFAFYIGFLIQGTESLTTIRLLRILRIFRILNMELFLKESYAMIYSIKKSSRKILIFMLFILLATMTLGTLMYMIERNVNPNISSIPKGIYWAVVTLTTVGYGDVTPVTDIGQLFSVIIMILGYSIIAVPTGIISAEMIKNDHKILMKCPKCNRTIDDDDNINFCKYCGTPLTSNE